MPTLMLVNPRARAGSGRKKARSPAQRAATKRMLAANRARRGGSHARRVTHKAKRRHNPVGLARVHHKRVVRHAAHRVVRRHKRRHNPLSLFKGSATGIMGMGMTALQGAGGALVINTALNYIPFMPAALKSGNGKYLARAGAAIAVGVFGKKLVGQKMATNMAIGALTVALHDLILGIASTAAPSLLLGDVGDYDTGVSEYLSGTAVDYGVTRGAGGDVYTPVGEFVS